jgi:RNA polymerase sigma-70 factor (ECF subfamily)
VNLEDDDSALIARVVRSRDERAFTALYRRHTAYLYQLGLRLSGGDDATSQDLVHEAWMRATQRLATYQARSPLRTWLAGFVINAWHESTRDHARTVALVDTDLPDEAVSREPVDRVDLERALAALAPGYREVLVLHDIEGYTHQDIAALLGMDVGTSKSQLSRARAAMRNALGGPPQGKGNRHG